MAKGIVLIHGMGEQESGRCLISVTNPLADYLEREIPKVNVIREAWISCEDGIPKVQLDIRKNGEPYTKWVFYEAWWAEAFKPPSMWAVLLWAIRQAPEQLRVMAEGIKSEREESRGFRYSPHNVVRSLTRELSHAYHSLIDIAIQLLPIIVIPLIFLLGPLIIAFKLLKMFPPFEWVSETLLGLIQRILVGSLGDTKRYIDHGIWAANVRCLFERVLEHALTAEEIDDVTVIAHSWGAVIAYEALLEWRDNNPGKRKPVKLVTVGAGLNRVPAMVRRSRSPHAEQRFSRKFAEEIEWLNIYTRYDPASCGRLRSGGILKLKKDIIQQKVINYGSPFSDHGSYWNNSAHVIPLFVRMIEGGDKMLPESGSKLLPDRVVREEAKKRWNRWIYLASSLRMLFIYVSFIGALLLAIYAQDIAIIERLSSWSFIMERAEDAMEFFQRSDNWRTFADWLIGTAATAAISFGAYSYIWGRIRPDAYRKRRNARV